MCRCKTRTGRPADALFFANRADYDKHYKMCSRALLQEYIVGVAQAVPASEFRDPTSGLAMRLPSYVVTDVSLSVDDALASMGSTQRTAAITGIAVHLLAGLAILHKKDIVHGSVARGNVVRLLSGKGTWAFRELCKYTKKGREIDVSALTHAEVLMLAPEAAEARYAEAAPPMDIWQVGVLMYELHTGESYWPADITSEQALRALARKGGMPHEADPTKLQAIVRGDSTLQRQVDIIARMLSRNPADRPTALDAKADLDNSVYQQTLYGDEASHLMVQNAVML